MFLSICLYISDQRSSVWDAAKVNNELREFDGQSYSPVHYFRRPELGHIMVMKKKDGKGKPINPNLVRVCYFLVYLIDYPFIAGLVIEDVCYMLAGTPTGFPLSSCLLSQYT